MKVYANASPYVNYADVVFAVYMDICLLIGHDKVEHITFILPQNHLYITRFFILLLYYHCVTAISLANHFHITTVIYGSSANCDSQIFYLRRNRHGIQ